MLGNSFSEDGTYDYGIPEDLGDAVYPGRFVTVPFGIANKLCTGIVMEVRDTSPYSHHKFILSLYTKA